MNSKQAKRRAPADKLGRAVEALNAGQAQIAARKLAKLIAKYPHDPDVVRLSALAYQQTGKHEQAVKLALRATQLAPELASAWFNLGSVQFQQTDYAAADTAYARGLELAPATASALFEHGMILRALKRHEEAATTFRTLAESVAPDDDQSWHQLGTSLAVLGRADDARAAFKAALDRAPTSADTWFALGNLDYRDRAWAAAVESYQRALAYRPEFAEAWVNLGQAQRKLNRNEDAEKSLAHAARLRPDDEIIQYLACGDTDAEGSAAPEQLVTAIFDGYADNFEAHLVERLGYQTPQMLSQALAESAATALENLRTLDLGCGTGLMGPHLRPWSSHLVGIDLSSEMLKHAAEKALYDALETSELLAYLQACAAENFDLVTAADVLCYIDELQDTFSAIAEVLSPGGLFAFSVELLAAQDSQNRRLGQGGRYQHAEAYINQCLTACKLETLSVIQAVVRKERGDDVAGLIVIAQRRR